MSQKSFFLVASIIFLLVAAGHAARLVLHWSVSLAGWPVPDWVSWVALIITLYLASQGLRLAKKS